MKKIISLIIAFMLAFTAGECFVFAGVGEYTDEEIITLDLAWLTSEMVLAENDYSFWEDFEGNIYYYNITGNLNLPTEGGNGSSISWTSSDETLIETDGTVHRPIYLHGNKTAVLAATVIKGEAQAEKTFNIEVVCIEPTSDELAVESDYNWLVGESVIHYGRYYNDIRNDVNLPLIGENGGTISWASSDESIIATDGSVTQPSFSYAMGNAAVTLTATISKGEASKQKTFTLEVVPQSPTDSDDVAIDKAWLTYEVVLNGNSSADNVKTRLNLQIKAEPQWTSAGWCGGCNIAWESSNPDVIAVDGSVTRPTKQQGDKTVTLTATISMGEEFDTKAFNLVVTATQEFPLAIKYGNFSDTSRLQFNGVSGSVDTTDRDGSSILALKFQNGSEAAGGSVFTKNKIRLGDDLSFSTVFSFRNPHPNNITGSGGFTFTLQTVSNTVYPNSLQDESFKPSLSVAFVTDYYTFTSGSQGTGYSYNINAKVYYNGNCDSDATTYVGGGSTNDSPAYYTAWIEYDGTAKVLEVWCAPSAERPAYNYMHLRQENVDLSQILTGAESGLETEDVRDIYAGFMGSMGTANESTEIGSWYFKNDPTPIDFVPYRFTDLSLVTLTADPLAGQASSTLTVSVSGDCGPVAGTPVEFFTSFGTLDAISAITDDLGKASVKLSSTQSGTAVVKAVAQGGAIGSAEVLLTVNDEDRLDFDCVWLTEEQILNENRSLSDVTGDLSLPVIAPNGSAISWSSSNTGAVAQNGVVTRPLLSQGPQQAVLTATLSIGELSKQKNFNVTVKVCDDDLVSADRDWLTEELILGENSDLDNINENMSLPLEGPNGSTISWTSDKTETVSPNGAVNRPSYTAGDKTVTLTATISMGLASLTKVFSITVVALEPTDYEAVNEDYDWLTAELILSGNESLTNVISDLNLPLLAPKGSSISWSSSDVNWIDNNGKVTRPSYSQGYKSVTLKAVVSRGYESDSKYFYIIVREFVTDAETVSLDKEWLNWVRIMGENHSSVEVTENLDLPVIGPKGSAISWSSNNENVIAADGIVSRPPYAQGNKNVMLTAAISKGGESAQITFYLIVLRLEQTDDEAVTADKSRLNAYSTLGQNPSPNAITQNLSLPTLLFNNSSATWVSSMPEVISNEGAVTRPEYGQGHKTVDITVTITKGSAVESNTFTYTVLSKPDTFVPKVTSTAPAQGDTDVLWDTQNITVTFDENIKAGTGSGSANSLGIELLSTGNTKISVRIDNNKLIVTPYADMASGINRLRVPAGAIADMSGNAFGDFELTFTVEERLSRKIEVTSSAPQDREKNVSVAPEISFSFNTADITPGTEFLKKIQLRTKSGSSVPVTPSLNAGVVTLTLGEELKPGVVYEIVISTGAVRDRFMNENGAKTISFKTLADSALPVITSVYPSPEQNSVDIRQSIKVNFSSAITPTQCGLTLRDNLGNIAGTYKNSTSTDKSTIILTPHVPLKPNTEYTLSGSYESQYDPSQLDFNMRFKTGANTPGIVKVSHEASDAPINIPVKIEFSSDITAGPALENITFTDAVGTPVPFTAEMNKNQAVLKPSTLLIPSESYTVNIPAGAYQDGSGNGSDSYQFSFTTAQRLKTDSYKISSISEWIVKKGMIFNTDSIEKVFKSANYQILSFEWDFGDETIGEGKNPVHTYNKAGEYKAVLMITDNKGFSYEFEKTVMIENPDNFEFTAVDSEYHTVFVTSRIRPKLTYKFRLEHRGLFVHGESIKPALCKNGFTQRVYPEIYANLGDNAYVFTFEPDYLLDGTYELVFTYQGKSRKKELRIPVDIFGTPSYIYTKIRLYDRDSGSFFEGNYLDVEVDGEKTVATREWDNKKNEYYYRIDKLLMNLETFSLKISGWEIGATELRALGDSFETQTIYGRPAKFGITRITNDLTGAERLNVFEGVSAGLINFYLQGEWKGLNKGYYELKTSTDSFNKTSYTGRIRFDPGKVLKQGEYIMVRMVSGEGIKSPWKYAPVYAAKPPVFMGSPINVSYVDGKSYLSAPAGLSEIIGSEIPLLKDIPLLSGGNFGLGGSTPSFSGYIDESGREAVLTFSGGGSYGTTTSKTTDTKLKKIKKIVSAGYEVEANIEGELYFTYNASSKEWELDYTYIDFDGYGGYSWTRGYKIPVINVGIDTELKMGSDVRGILCIDDSGSGNKYSGIIGIAPTVGVSVMLGADWVNVTGSVEGSIPAEIHYPTWYVGADVSITAKITGTFLLYTDTLYEKNLFSAHWDNGNKKVVLKAVSNEEEPATESQGLKLMSRNYLNRESRWLSDVEPPQKALFALNSDNTSESNLETALMMENVYPEAEVQLVQSGDELWLVWTDDNPQRSDTNRTQMRYSVLKDGSWLTPKWIGQDETADFAPAIAATQNGTLMAWQNIKQAVAEDDGLGGMIRNAEITVTGSAFSTEGNEPQLVTLTDDDKFDHSPKLAADGDSALLVWTKSEGLGIALNSDMEEFKSPANSDRLFFSVWNGITWSEAAQIEDSLPTVLNSNLTMHGEEGLLLYNLDMDNNMSTMEDREIFARIYDGNSWGNAVRLTENQTKNSSPKAVYANGKWFITWLQDGKIMYRQGLDGETKTDELLQNVQSDYKIIAGQGENSQIAIVYKQLGENKVQTLSAYFYDVNSGMWGGELSLTQEDGYTGSFSPVFTKDGKLSVAYSSAEIITEVINGVEQKNASDKVDLRTATYSPIRDLALDQVEGLHLSSEIPLPNTVTTVFATVRNEGDFPENAIVELYDGNPSYGSEKIAEAVIKQPVPAHSSADVQIEWLVGAQEKDEYELYAVVRSSDGVQDINKDNNTISLNILTADIAVTKLESENIAGNDYTVTATIANLGSKTIEGIEVCLGQPQDAEVLKTTEIERLEPGQKVNIDFLLSRESLMTDKNGKVNMVLRALTTDDEQENSEENNLCEFTLEAASISVEATNPGQGENLVGIQTPLTLGFNMAVEEREQFEKIILEDDELNEISISKTLQGDTLTITPQGELQHDTEYTLTIPAGAFGDAYGHSMSEPYVLSFVTTASSPQVVFSYPGSGMEDTKTDTDIRLQFNQQVLKGPAFADIALYSPADKKIGVSVSIEKEWLIITPKAPLDKSAAYRLVIPKGAVQNDKNEAQQEDYTLEFTTGETSSGVGKRPSAGNGGALLLQQYNVSRSIVENGRRKAIVEINEQAIVKSDAPDVTVTLIDELKNDDIIQINLGNSVLSKLSSYNMGINIITGKGDICFPADMTASLAKEQATVTAHLVDGDKPTIQLTLRANGKEIPWDNPDLPFVISIPYTPTEEEMSSPESIIILFTDSSGNEVSLPYGHYDSAAKTITVSITRFGHYAVGYNKIIFNDVSEGTWYNKAVSFVAARSITLGTGSGNYSPDANLTRGQFIVMLMRAYDISPDVNSMDNFSDSGNTYTGYLAAAKRLGLSSGVGNNMFAPDNEITRQEMFTLLYNVLKTVGKLPKGNSGKTLANFSDAGKIDTWSREAMALLVETGIIEGADGKLSPISTATRAEMAQMLYNLLLK